METDSEETHSQVPRIHGLKMLYQEYEKESLQSGVCFSSDSLGSLTSHTTVLTENESLSPELETGDKGMSMEEWRLRNMDMLESSKIHLNVTQVNVTQVSSQSISDDSKALLDGNDNDNKDKDASSSDEEIVIKRKRNKRKT